MPSGANAFEISDIQEQRNREPALTKRELAMLHCIGNLPRYQFARDTGGSAQNAKTLRAEEEKQTCYSTAFSWKSWRI